MARKVAANLIGRRTGARNAPLAAVTPEAEILAAKKAKIAELWQRAHDWEAQFFSGGIYAQMLELKLNGSQKAVANQHWILGVWRDYYARNDTVMAMLTLDEIRNASADFSMHGAPPFTVRQMLQDAPIV
jgi:hypothetical protein